MTSSTSIGEGPSASSTRWRAVSDVFGRRRHGGLLLAEGAHRRSQRGAEHRLDRRDDVVRLGGDDGACLEQAVGARGARIERRARHGEDDAALLAGEARGDQRAGPLRRFDDDDAERQARDDAVAPRKIPGAWVEAKLRFGKAGPAFGDDAFGKWRVFGRVDAVEAACEDGDRARREGGLMRGGIDAAGKAGDDDEAA